MEFIEGMQVQGAKVVGIDVGGARKGFHAVALYDGRYLDKVSCSDVTALAEWCRAKGAQAIAIDAPCRWSRDGRARPAERELMAKKIWCFSTPTREAAVAHPRDHFGWMLNGVELFRQLEQDYVLFGGSLSAHDRPICFETFPQAIACSLAGTIISAKQKSVVRRKLLTDAGIDIARLTNIDWMDAALCALTAHRMLSGKIASYGESETGFIVVPLRC